MSDIKILQVDVDDLPVINATEMCSKLISRLPGDIIVIPRRGDKGKITAINIDSVYDIHFTDVNGLADNINISGEELYESIKRVIESKRGE